MSQGCDGCGCPQTHCLPSAVVGCLFCAHGCDNKKLGAKLAFYPPSPPRWVRV